MQFICEENELDKMVAGNFTNLDLLEYASVPRRKIAEAIDVIFDNIIWVNENNVNELITRVIELLGDMRKKADEFDRTKEKKRKQKAMEIRDCFEEAMGEIDSISNNLLGIKIQLITETKLYNEQKENIFREYRELSANVSNLKKAIESVKEQVSGLRDIAESSKEMIDIEKYNAREGMLRQMETKLCDLEKSLLIALQTVCQLNLVAMNNASLCEQMQRVMFEGMSVFKNSIIITVGNREAKAAIQMILSAIEGAKLIQGAQNKYESSRTECKKLKNEEAPTNLAGIEKEIAKLQGIVVVQ